MMPFLFHEYSYSIKNNSLVVAKLIIQTFPNNKFPMEFGTSLVSFGLYGMFAAVQMAAITLGNS